MSVKNAHGFTKDQVADFKTQFDSFDEDGGGSISTGELKNVLEKCGVQVSDSQVKDMVTEFDTDGDGELDFQEFLTMMHRLTSGPTEKDIRKVIFEIFDENLDGFVTFNELQAAWRTAAAETQGAVSVPSDDVLRAMIAEADTDGDGKLSEEEFLNVIEQCA